MTKIPDLDLHGVKHEDVSKILDAFIWENMKLKERHIGIVTGNSEHMKKIVNDLLKEYGYVSEQSMVNSGLLYVTLD